MQQKEYGMAAALCPKILRDNKKLWEEWILKYASLHILDVISPFIPIANPQLPSHIYEMILAKLLQVNNQAGFLETVRKWPRTLYDNIKSVIAAVEAKLLQNTPSGISNLDREQTMTNSLLMDALAELYLSFSLCLLHGRTTDEKSQTEIRYIVDNNPEKALLIYLRIKRGDVFGLIKKFGLYSIASTRAVQLIEYSVEDAVNLFVDNLDKITTATIVKQLNVEAYRHYLFSYLDALFRKDPKCSQLDTHQETLLLMYADYDKPKLLPFLTTADKYNLETAYQIVSSRKFHREVVYILRRMGNYKQALNIIIAELKDVKQGLDSFASSSPSSPARPLAHECVCRDRLHRRGQPGRPVGRFDAAHASCMSHPLTHPLTHTGGD